MEITKDKVKFGVAVFACILAIWILYKTLSKVSDNKTTAAGKIDAANADLEIQKGLDQYTSEREELSKSEEEQKVQMLEQTTIAGGYTNLEDYMNSLQESVRRTYESRRSEYIRVMGVDPGLMSYSDLNAWYEKYNQWTEYNRQYINLTGESKSILDPDYDTVEEMQAAVVSAEASIEHQKEEIEDWWRDEYELFCNDREGLKGCPYIGLDDLRKWLQSPADILPFQEYLTGKYNSWMLNRRAKLDAAYKSLRQYFNEGYINWKNSNKNFVRGANDLPQGTYDEVSDFNVNDFCYTSLLLRNDGGVDIFSYVSSTNAPHDKMNWTNWYDASLAVANFQYSYEEGTNILGAVLSFGISAAIQKNNKVREYMPDRLNKLMSRMEAAYTQNYTPFGHTQESLVDQLSYYSQELYGFNDYTLEMIMDNQMDLQDFLKSEEYKKL